MLLESPRLKIVDPEDDDFFTLPKPVQEHGEEKVEEEEESKIEENCKELFVLRLKLLIYAIFFWKKQTQIN